MYTCPAVFASAQLLPHFQRCPYYECNVRGYAVIPGVDIRCHAFSHQYRVIKLKFKKKLHAVARRSAPYKVNSKYHQRQRPSLGRTNSSSARAARVICERMKRQKGGVQSDARSTQNEDKERHREIPKRALTQHSPHKYVLLNDTAGAEAFNQV